MTTTVRVTTYRCVRHRHTVTYIHDDVVMVRVCEIVVMIACLLACLLACVVFKLETSLAYTFCQSHCSMVGLTLASLCATMARKEAGGVLSG